MKKIIIALSILMVVIIVSIFTYFIIINEKRVVSISSHDNTVLDFGEHKVSEYEKNDFYKNKNISLFK